MARGAVRTRDQSSRNLLHSTGTGITKYRVVLDERSCSQGCMKEGLDIALAASRAIDERVESSWPCDKGWVTREEKSDLLFVSEAAEEATHAHRIAPRP